MVICISVTITSTNEFFETFDEERYNISYSDGGIQTLREENLVFSADRKSVTLSWMSQNASGNIYCNSKENRS